VRGILQTADENLPPYRLIERAAPDVLRRVAAGSDAAIEYYASEPRLALTSKQVVNKLVQRNRERAQALVAY